jgi:hypothetical protein
VAGDGREGRITKRLAERGCDKRRLVNRIGLWLATASVVMDVENVGCGGRKRHNDVQRYGQENKGRFQLPKSAWRGTHRKMENISPTDQRGRKWRMCFLPPAIARETTPTRRKSVERPPSVAMGGRGTRICMISADRLAALRLNGVAAASTNAVSWAVETRAALRQPHAAAILRLEKWSATSSKVREIPFQPHCCWIWNWIWNRHGSGPPEPKAG